LLKAGETNDLKHPGGRRQMTVYTTDNPPSKGGSDRRVSVDSGELPEVEVFRRLAESRRRNDRSQIQPLQTELRRLGWQVLAIAPRSGKAVTR
jgi:hypothetical protein